MTARDAINKYLESMPFLAVSACATAMGVTRGAVSNAVQKMRISGDLTVEKSVKPYTYRRTTPEERELALSHLRPGRRMSGWEAILEYLDAHNDFTWHEVSKFCGVSVHAVRQAGYRMLESRELVLVSKGELGCHRYGRSVQSDEDSIPALSGRGFAPRSSNNPIIKECRVRWKGYEVHKIFGSASRGMAEKAS